MRSSNNNNKTPQTNGKNRTNRRNNCKHSRNNKKCFFRWREIKEEEAKKRRKKKKSRPDEDELSNQASKRSYKTCHTNNFFECAHTHMHIYTWTRIIIRPFVIIRNFKSCLLHISREAADGWIHSYIGIWLNVVMYIYYNTYIQMNEVIWGKRRRKQKNKTLLSIINANVVRKKIRKLSKSHS